MTFPSGHHDSPNGTHEKTGGAEQERDEKEGNSSTTEQVMDEA